LVPRTVDRYPHAVSPAALLVSHSLGDFRRHPPLPRHPETPRHRSRRAFAARDLGGRGIAPSRSIAGASAAAVAPSAVASSSGSFAVIAHRP
jgi:hypothetical protein